MDFNTDKIKSLGGVDVPKDQQKSILESLGFSVLEKDNIFSITSPSFRPDIKVKLILLKKFYAYMVLMKYL